VRFAALASELKLRTHAFGIGGPAAITVLHFTPVTSFDSAGWIRTAAYGNVYLPYVGAVNITGAPSRRYVTKREFNGLRRATGHFCEFCVDENRLARSWAHRALHNFSTVEQVVEHLKQEEPLRTLERLRLFNSRFAGYLQLVLEERARGGSDSTSPANGVAQ
jgi:hypothetical protein